MFNKNVNVEIHTFQPCICISDSLKCVLIDINDKKKYKKPFFTNDFLSFL